MDEVELAEIRKTAYHEAAHAALDWNLGFGVRWIVINRSTSAGKAMAARLYKSRFERVGAAVVNVAGLAAQSLLQPRMEGIDLARSRTDLRRCATYLASDRALTDGEQLALALHVTRRVVPLLHAAEIQKQLQKLVGPLLRDGRMFEAQVHGVLQRLPASLAARRRCRSFVADLEGQVHELVRGAAGRHPNFDWRELDPPAESGAGPSD
jgi:hypothetical protein